MFQSTEQNLSCAASPHSLAEKVKIYTRQNPPVQRLYKKKVFFQKKFSALSIGILLMGNSIVLAQSEAIDKNKFFTDEQLIEINIDADFNSLIKKKLKPDFKLGYLPATITCHFPDSVKLTEAVEIRARGKYRREECIMPPIMVNFKISTTSSLKKLGQLKLVWPCGTGHYDEQLVLKEYLVYKIYNQLTEKSFRVRLVRVSFHDTKEKIKSQTLYAFFMEDVDEMAHRNNCNEVHNTRFNTEATNREQATLVTLFEYMIGNCDWAIPIYRNIKIIRSKTDTFSKPYAVPYDFDYCGLVDARYAIPPEGLPITSVKERYYLGFPRTMEELNSTLQVFRNQQQVIDSLIRDFALLDESNKKEMTKYLHEFFKITEKQETIKELFINNARRE